MRRLNVLLLMSLLLPGVSQAGFGEFGFCPLGGPPGWINRLTGQHNKRYYAPPPPRYTPVMPNGWQQPYMAYPPFYLPHGNQHQ